MRPLGASEQDPLWSKPCLAYNLHAELDAQCREDLADVQERLHRPSLGALRCPAPSLHLSVATILSVRQDYGTPKDLIWESWGRKWSASLRELAAGLQPFVVRFTSLQVSTAAVIAIADPVPEVGLVRARAKELLSEAGLQAVTTVHPSLHPGALCHLRAGLGRCCAFGTSRRAQGSDGRYKPCHLQRACLSQPGERDPGPPAVGVRPAAGQGGAGCHPTRAWARARRSRQKNTSTPQRRGPV